MQTAISVPKVAFLLSLVVSLAASSLRGADRVALLVGCANYQADPANLSLDTPLNDMNDLAATLESPALGFEVIKVADATRVTFDAGLAKFKAAATGSNVALIYFSGHGIEHGNDNYLITVNATLESEFELPSQTMPLENVMKVLGGTGASVKVAVLDCCRNNPFRTKSWVKTKDFQSNQVLRELGEAEIPQATLVCFATGAGRKAAAVLRAGSVRSPFTDELIREIAVPGLPLRTVFENVHDRVVEATQGRQVPAVKTDNALSVVFRKTVLVPGTTPSGGQMVAQQTQPPPILPGVPTTPPAFAGSVLDQGEVGKVIQAKLPGDVVMKFCYCPPGSFVMGSPSSEAGRRVDEDQVTVRISKGFWTGQMEVTQGQWKALMGTSLAQQRAKENSFRESNGIGDDHPMYFVSWDEAEAFIAELNEIIKLPAGWKFALLTEAQWEYACRAGTKSVFAFGNTLTSKLANFNGNFPYGVSTTGPNLGKTAPVGSYEPNTWGLYDMHGNVLEWCADEYGEKLAGGTDPQGPATGAHRVFRGGSWFFVADHCRAASRSRSEPGIRRNYLGFRPALVPSR